MKTLKKCKTLKNVLKIFAIMLFVVGVAVLISPISGGGLCAIEKNAVVSSAKTQNAHYDSVSKVIDIDENKVCDITETFVITFENPNINVGMTRNVSKVNFITRIYGGKKYQTRTIATLDHVSVVIQKSGEGSSKHEYFFTDEDDEYYYIYTGMDGDYKQGTYIYTINYRYNLGYDYINAFDDFTFDVLDYGSMSDIGEFSCRVNLPKEVEGLGSSGDLLFRTNDMKDIDETFGGSDFSFSVEGKTIECHASNIEKGNGITMQLILPNKYFANENKPSILYILAFVMCFISIILAIIIVLCLRFGKKSVKTIEFYPPKNYSPIGVSRAYRGVVRQKDFASLIIDWAAKGYVKIDFLKDKKNQVEVTKLKDLQVPEKEEGDYSTAKKEKEYFDALFADGDVFNAKNLSASQKQKIARISQKIIKKNKKSLKKQLFYQTFITFIAIIPFLLYTIWTYIAGFGNEITIAAFIFILIAAEVLINANLPLGLIWFKIIWCAMFGGIPIFMLITTNAYAMDFLWLRLIVVLSFVACVFVSSYVVVFDEKDLKVRGQILGFRDFLVKAELDKLERLLADDPQYYYNILPYCYSLGITKIMEKKFKQLRAPEPDYLGGCDAATFYHLYAANMFVNASFSSTSVTRGGGFGGGGFGGSSGGGGGGGGFGGR